MKNSDSDECLLYSPHWYESHDSNEHFAVIKREFLAVRLLILEIQEPQPGRVLPEMAADHGPEEAARRYRATVVTTLRQLRGLVD